MRLPRIQFATSFHSQTVQASSLSRIHRTPCSFLSPNKSAEPYGKLSRRRVRKQVSPCLWAQPRPAEQNPNLAKFGLCSAGPPCPPKLFRFFCTEGPCFVYREGSQIRSQPGGKTQQKTKTICHTKSQTQTEWHSPDKAHGTDLEQC